MSLFEFIPMRTALFMFILSTAFAFEMKPPIFRSLPSMPRSYVAFDTTRSLDCPRKAQLMRLQADEGSADAHLAAVATGADMESLADIVLSIEVDAERRGALLVAIQGWPPAERAERVDSFVKALTARGESIQAEGKAAFERGEPTTGAEKKLWAIVDMTVGVNVMVKRVEEAEAEEAAATAPKARSTKLDTISSSFRAAVFE